MANQRELYDYTNLALSLPPPSSLTPAKAPPKFKNADALEFFEGVNGHTFFRQKASAKKDMGGVAGGGERRGYARPQATEHIMLPRRMNMSGKKTEAPPSSGGAASLQPPGRTLARGSPSREGSHARAGQGGSASRMGQGSASRLPCPSLAQHQEAPARKGLLFQPRRSLAAAPPRQTFLPPPPRPERFQPPRVEVVVPELHEEFGSQEQFVPGSQELFVPAASSGILDPRESLVGGRESLAWVAGLPRQSLSYRELHKLMSDKDKRNLDDDNTDSFEAMEKRMRTPVKKQKIIGLREIEESEAKGFVEVDVEKENMPIDSEGVSNEPSDAAAMEDMDVKCSRENTTNTNMESDQVIKEGRIYSTPSHKVASCQGDMEEVLESEVMETDPSASRIPFSPLVKSQSLGCLSSCREREEGGQGPALASAASALDLGQGEHVIFSDLVPTDQVRIHLAVHERLAQERLTCVLSWDYWFSISVVFKFPRQICLLYKDSVTWPVSGCLISLESSFTV